jgi:hypothetical protein
LKASFSIFRRVLPDAAISATLVLFTGRLVTQAMEYLTRPLRSKISNPIQLTSAASLPWPAGQQFGLPHAATGCVCTETTIAVPVPSASASKARIKVVTFMISSPKADNWLSAFSDFLGAGNCLASFARASFGSVSARPIVWSSLLPSPAALRGGR